MKNLLETVPDLVWQKDINGVYLQCNRAIEQFLGVKKNEVIGKTAYDFLSLDLADALREHDRTVIKENRVVTSEEWMTSPHDGRSMLYETIRSPLADEAGSVIGVFGIARDVTQRHDAHKEAKFFRSLVQNSSDSIFVLDPEDGYRMVFANEAACRHFGVSNEELLTMRVTDWDPDVTPEMLEKIQAQVNDNDALVFETRHRRRPDEVVPVEVSANRLYYEGRKYHAGYIRDISKRKQAEEELHKSHKQIVDITSNVPGVVYEFQRTPEGQYGFLFMGETVQTMFGVKPEEICNNLDLMYSFVHPDDLEELYISIEESAQTLRNWHKEFRIVLPENDIRWLLGSSNPERQENGAIIWHGCFTDISKIKHTENALKESQDRLRKLIGYQDHIREKERKQAAKELHDELAQHLLAIKIDLSLLPRNVGVPSMLTTTVEEIVERVDVMIKSTREIMNNLRPSVLDLGLYAALDWQTKEFERKSGIACSLAGKEDELQLDEQSATALFRIMQGALAGIQRQGQATHVTVDLRRCESDVLMTVTDDGVLDVVNGADQIEHFGMVGINERIGMFGGSAKVVRNERDDGSALSVSIPLKAQTQRRLL